MKYIITAMLSFSCCTLFAQQNYQISSPGKATRFAVHVRGNEILYSVWFNGKPVITDGRLGAVFADKPDAQYKPGKAEISQGADDYQLVVGKASHITDKYTQMRIPFSMIGSTGRGLALIVRAFEDGVAFRYAYAFGGGDSSLRIVREKTDFRFAGDPTMLGLLLPNYTSSHEGEYTSATISTLTSDTLVDLPALFQLPGGAFAAVTEAALVNYAGMYLVKHQGVMQSSFAPLPSDTSIMVRSATALLSPWRVILLSGRAGGVLESNILTSLNEPSKIGDASWLKPGKTTFPWWNGNVVPDTLNAPGNNFVTNQYYIDFCARNNIGFHTVVEYGLHQWYTDDGVGFQPGPHADVTTPVPGLDMKQVCDYAHSKGVEVRVWVHWAALYPKLDSAFAIFERWGLSGMMVDFMDRDDQEMVLIQEEILQKAAKHHLHIQFHGAYRPTGLHRTYPNELTREGTLNYETNKWGKRCTPSHDLNIIFTRMIAGSTDYHLGGFRAVPDSLYKVQYTRPLMLGTRTHMMAMYVVMENYLGMVCDYPAAYEGQPGFEFLQAVPTIWDETSVLQAELHGYIVIARRSGKDWYIGAINNEQARTLTIDFSFLGAGVGSSAAYDATIFTDAPDVAVTPDHITKKQAMIRAADKMNIALAPGGGFALMLKGP